MTNSAAKEGPPTPFFGGGGGRRQHERGGAPARAPDPPVGRPARTRIREQTGCAGPLHSPGRCRYAGPEAMASIWRASVRSAWVMPPAEWVDNRSVTAFQWMKTAGGW